MKRSTRILALLLCALLLLSGCAAEEATDAAEAFSASEPAPSPTPEPTPVPTPEPTAEPVMRAETEASGAAASYILPGQTDSTVLVCWSGAYCAEGMSVLYGIAGEDDALPAEPSAAAAVESRLDDCFSADRMQYVAELSVEPATRYAYAVVKNGAEPDAVYHFRTNDADELHTAAVSDTHLYSHRDHPALFEDMFENILRTELDGGRSLDMIIHTGDILDHAEYSLDTIFNGIPMLRSFLLASVAGNHDSLFVARHRIPMTGQDKTTGDFWFVRGGVLFIGIQIENRNFAAHAKYMRSLPEIVPEHNWTVMLIHYSMRSNGLHGHDGPVAGFRDALEPTMDALDVDLIISGHDHEYNRTALLGGDEPAADTSDILYKQPGERMYITLPSGTGLKLYYGASRSADYPFVAEGLEEEPGFVLFDFTPDEITLSARSSATGEEIDSVTLRRAAATTEEE